MANVQERGSFTMLTLLLAAALAAEPVHARQGQIVILQLTDEECASDLSVFGRRFQCGAAGRVVIGVDFKAKLGAHDLGNTGRTIVVRDGEFDKVYRRRRPGRGTDPKVRAREEQRMAEAIKSALTRYPQWPAGIEFRYPLQEIQVTDKFGIKRLYHTRSRKSATELQHRGVDLRANYGTPVQAASYGAVVLAERFSWEGNMVVLYHGDGIYTLYMHLKKFNCIPGQIVYGGDVIAYSGDTGAPGAPHLHFAVKIYDAVVNPLKFIESYNAYLAEIANEQEGQ